MTQGAAVRIQSATAKSFGGAVPKRSLHRGLSLLQTGVHTGISSKTGKTEVHGTTIVKS